MNHFFHPHWISACLLALPVQLWAQSMALRPASDPTNPAAPTAPMRYQSVFSPGERHPGEPMQDWKQANTEVGRFTRGHIDLLRAEQGTPAQPLAPKP